MRSTTLLLVAVFFSVVAGEDVFGMKLTTEASLRRESTQYRFHYFVKDETTGDYKLQQETKKGDLVQGSYTLAEPNGDLRTVTYKAGPGKGFEAKVDVHPSGSPMKQTPPQVTTTPGIVNRTEQPVESTVKHFSGEFKTSALSKPTITKTGMEFTLLTNTPLMTPLSSSLESKVTEKPTATSEVTNTTFAVENSTSSTESKEINEDQIEKEIDEVINSMPKLPELVLSDNKTKFKFYKDPEEALLDERITQIARQLAETSLRREYEERKLGHIIPISVSVEPSTSRYLSKSFKYTPSDMPSIKPFEPSTLHVLTQLKIVPQYIYKQTFPRLFPVNNRLPAISRPAQVTKLWEMLTQDTITNPSDILKINKQPTELHKMSQETERTTLGTPESVMPFHVPTLMQFFSPPYVMYSPGSYITPSQPDSPIYTTGTVKKDFTMKEIPVTDDNLFAHVTTVNNHDTEKP